MLLGGASTLINDSVKYAKLFLFAVSMLTKFGFISIFGLILTAISLTQYEFVEIAILSAFGQILFYVGLIGVFAVALKRGF